MKINLHLYPTLTQTMYEEAGIHISDLDFYYDREKLSKGSVITERRKLNIEDNNITPIELLDKKGVWDIAHDNLEIVQHILIDNPQTFFGINGIAHNDSTIGVAVKWSSLDSLQKGVKKIIQFDNDSKQVSKEIRLNIGKGQIRSQLNYELILYIVTPSPEKNTFLANEYGLVVGELFEETLILEGDASSFPIVSIEDEGAPLWSLYCMWPDLNSPFTESIRLRLNKAHSKYDLLNMESKKYNPYLFNQILISVVVQILETAKEQNELEFVEETDEFPIGSVGSLIKYYLETYQIKYDCITDIYNSVNTAIWR